MSMEFIARPNQTLGELSVAHMEPLMNSPGLLPTIMSDLDKARSEAFGKATTLASAQLDRINTEIAASGLGIETPTTEEILNASDMVEPIGRLMQIANNSFGEAFFCVAGLKPQTISPIGWELESADELFKNDGFIPRLNQTSQTIGVALFTEAARDRSAIIPFADLDDEGLKRLVSPDVYFAQVTDLFRDQPSGELVGTTDLGLAIGGESVAKELSPESLEIIIDLGRNLTNV
ncbi:hypothetical protein KBF61_03595 [Candidatus Saccharibacteria bacterium]|nr:hypothetical protein [Candidatus Saccharibacteria bacterium]